MSRMSRIRYRVIFIYILLGTKKLKKLNKLIIKKLPYFINNIFNFFLDG